ncbi:hypothetical protein [Microbulbifer magnicolonia]|uniref:amidohydrolase family protein n=1 Tax=Microbulbifer magnicolonia TaxID=3109744 RepID=UPI002B4176AA|nr:hypothetical protein [Microbulbifer sp. GG15]
MGLLTLALSQAPALAGTFAITGGQWFDGQDFRADHWYIDSRGTFTKRKPENIDHVIDASGKYLLPPFADAHNHNLQNAWGVNNFGPLQQKSGIYYLAQMCDFGEGLRAQFAGAETLDVRYSSDCISASDGHPLGLILAGESGEATEAVLVKAREQFLPVDDPEQLDRAWQKVLAHKPDFIKVVLIASEKFDERHGAADYRGINGIDPDLVPEIVARARRLGVPVVAHVDTARDAAVAIEAGVEVLAHLPGYRIAKNEGFAKGDYLIDNETIVRAAKQGTKLIATASVPGEHGRYSADELAEIQEIQKLNLSRLQAAGVPLLMGSDNVFGTVLSEINYLDALGIADRSALLRSLTMDTPQWLFPQRRLGRFSEGAEGSFLMLAGNPLENLDFLGKIEIGVKQGHVMTTAGN